MRAGAKRARDSDPADGAGDALPMLLASTPDTVKKCRTVRREGTVKVKTDPSADNSHLGKACTKLEVKQEPIEETEHECVAPAPSTSCHGGLMKDEPGAIEIKSEHTMKLRMGGDLNGCVTRESPVFPGWNHPSVEECYALDRELAALHGEKPIPAPSGMSIMDSLVATILSQATTGKNSRAAFASLKDKFSSWEQVRVARTGDIEDAIRMGGLAAVKAQRIQEICQTVHRERGKVCLEHLATASTETIKQDLSRFPGCGPKTISCVLLFNLQRPDFAVDTHVFRLTSAAGWVPSQVCRVWVEGLGFRA